MSLMMVMARFIRLLFILNKKRELIRLSFFYFCASDFDEKGLLNCSSSHSLHLYFLVFRCVICFSTKLRRDGSSGNIALQFLHLAMESTYL